MDFDYPSHYAAILKQHAGDEKRIESLSQAIDRIHAHGNPVEPPSQEVLERMADEWEAEQPSEISKGWQSGLQNLQATGYGAMGLVGSATGIDSLRDYGYEGYQRNMEEAGEVTPRVSSVTDIGSFEDAADWVMGTVGQLAPSLLEAAASVAVGGGAAGLAGKTALKNTLKRKIMTEVSENVAKGMTADQAKKLVVGKLIQAGRDAGLVAGVGAIEAGGNFGEAADEVGVENVNPLVAGGMGLVSGATELVSPSGAFLRKVGPGMIGDLGKRLPTKISRGLEIPKAMIEEGAQEVVQEGLSDVSKLYHNPDAEISGEDYLNSFAGGAVGGGFFGGMNAGLSMIGKPKPLSDHKSPDMINEARKETVPDADINQQTAEQIRTPLPGTGVAKSWAPEQLPGAGLFTKNLPDERPTDYTNQIGLYLDDQDAMDQVSTDAARAEQEFNDPSYLARVENQRRMDGGNFDGEMPGRDMEAEAENGGTYAAGTHGEYKSADVRQASGHGPRGIQPKPLLYDNKHGITDALNMLRAGIRDLDVISGELQTKHGIDQETAQATIQRAVESLGGGVEGMGDGQFDSGNSYNSPDMVGSDDVRDRGGSGGEVAPMGDRNEKDLGRHPILQPNGNDGGGQINGVEAGISRRTPERGNPGQDLAGRGERDYEPNNIRDMGGSTYSGPEVEERKREGGRDNEVGSEDGWKADAAPKPGNRGMGNNQPNDFGLDPDQQQFIQNKVQSLGSVEATDKFYFGKDKVAKYGRQYAREIFAPGNRTGTKTDNTPKQNEIPGKEQSKTAKNYPEGVKLTSKGRPYRKRGAQNAANAHTKKTGEQTELVPLGGRDWGWKVVEKTSDQPSVETVTEPLNDSSQKTDEKPRIGEGRKVGGIDSILADYEVVDGVSYELYNANKLRDKRAVVHVKDVDSGEAVSTKIYPDFDAAEKEFKKTVEIVSRETHADGTQAGLPLTDETQTERKFDESGRVSDGRGGILPGDVFKTSSGRKTTPYPRQKSQKHASAWLIENAVMEAESRGDKWNANIFKGTTTLKDGSLTVADGESLNMYLFGEQPKVPRQSLKPLETQSTTDQAESVRPETDGAALDGGSLQQKRLRAFNPSQFVEINKDLEASARAAMGDIGKDRPLSRDEHDNKYSSKAVFSHNGSDYAVYRLPASGGRTGMNSQYNYPEQVHIYKTNGTNEDPTRNPLRKPDYIIKNFTRGSIESVKSKDDGPPRSEGLGAATEGQRSIKDRLASGESFKSIREARAAVSEETGEKITPGTTQAKEADEHIELSAVQVARDIVSGPGSRHDKYKKLIALHGQMPNLSVRTSTSVREQAYSTPLPLAYVASELAGIKSGKTVYEPTAGNGALVMGADLSAHVNELNQARHGNLIKSGFTNATNNDAAIWKPKESVDTVIANPPFGIVKDGDGNTKRFKITDDYTTSQIDHAIAIKALEAMRDDGSAVLIVGSVKGKSQDGDVRKRLYRRKDKRDFYHHLYAHYNVVDHFTVDGKLYEKQGASWPVDVISIKGRGKSSLHVPGYEAPRVITSYEDLGGVLDENNIMVPERSGRESDTGRGDQGRARNVDRQTNVYDDSGRQDSRPVADRERKGSDRNSGSNAGARSPIRDSRNTDKGKQPVNTGGEQPVPVRRHGDDGRVGQSSSNADEEQRGSRGNTDTGRNGGDRELAVKPSPVKQKESSTQSRYTPKSRSAAIGTLTPVNMQKSIGDALDKLSSDGDIDSYVAKELDYNPKDIQKYFSAEQVDAIALALSNMNNNSGFIIGDQTGIGKGRVVAAIIRHSMINGRMPIFITEKPVLYKDMYRDLTDIGMREDVYKDIFITNGGMKLNLNDDGTAFIKTPPSSTHNSDLLNYAGGEEFPHKAIFTTYDQLNEVGSARRAFIESMVQHNGVLILDESHNAGGAGADARPMKRKDGKEPYPRAKFLRDMIEKASGVFYSSATYAKRPDVMDLYSKTDIRLAVEDIKDLPETIQKGGIPLQQVVATMLTGAGQYVRRERSFEGVTYETVESKVNHKQAGHVSTALREINEFDQYVQAAISRVGDQLSMESGAASGRKGVGQSGITSTNFSSVMHNLIDQMLLSIKTDAAIDEATRALESGEKVVITLANTMGSFIDDYAAKHGLKQGDTVGLTFNEMLDRYLEKTREYTDGKAYGKKETKYLDDEQLGPEGLAKYRSVKKMIVGFDLGSMPVSPIDYIKFKLGNLGYAVDEITGRQTTLEYSGGGQRLSSRKNDIKARANAISGFNDGSIDCLVLNRSGSTGISLHASERNPESGQRKRRMIILQAEKNIDTHMQMLGRVHRTGQVIAPAYSQLIADIPAEKRPAAVLSAKMASLNANTTASRDSDFKSKEAPDFINKYGDIVVASVMENYEEIHRKLGTPLKPKDNGEGLQVEDAAKKVTGRIPLLTLKEQEEIYSVIEGEYADYIAQLDAMGENMLEAKTLDLDAKTKDRAVIFESSGNSPFQEKAVAEKADIKKIGRPYTSDFVKKAVEKELSGMTGKEHSKAMVEPMREKAINYGNDLLETIENEDSKESTRDRLNNTFSRWSWLMRNLEVGGSYTISMPNASVVIDGVLLKVEQKGTPKNPVALGTWKAVFALADGSRRISVPFTKLENSTMPQDGHIGFSKAGRDNIPLFDQAQTTTRETRTIITGNILAGYDQFRAGRIINYTNNSGQVVQGILMPHGFDLGAESAKKGVAFKTVDQVEKFLFYSNDKGMLVKTKDWNLTISHSDNGRMKISTMASKLRGGKYFLNDGLISAIGDDFVKSGGDMVAYFDKGRLKRVVESVMGIEKIVSPDYLLDKARDVTGEKVVDFEKKDDVKKSTTRAVSTTPATLSELSSKQRRALTALTRNGKVELVSNDTAQKILKNAVGAKSSYAGRKAKTANLSMLEKAKKSIKDGETAQSVRRETGWFQGRDREWRFEIPDNEMSLAPVRHWVGRAKTWGLKLNDILRHDKLFEAYPQLKDIDILVSPDIAKSGYMALFDFMGGNIVLSEQFVNDENSVLDLFAHELQHAIQHTEGFITGTSWDRVDGSTPEEMHVNYAGHPGEVEADDVKARRRHGIAYRRLIEPYSSQKDKIEAKKKLDDSYRVKPQTKARHKRKTPGPKPGLTLFDFYDWVEANLDNKKEHKLSDEPLSAYLRDSGLGPDELDYAPLTESERSAVNRFKEGLEGSEEDGDQPAHQPEFAGAVEYDDLMSSYDEYLKYSNDLYHVKYSKDGQIQGFYLNGKAYIIPENISAGKLWPVLRHEIGVHMGQLMQTRPEFNRILKTLENLKEKDSEQGRKVKEAFDRVPKDTNPEHVSEEALAYLIENSPEIGIVRRFITMIKRLLVKLGVGEKIFTQEDYAAMADAALRREAKSPTGETAKDAMKSTRQYAGKWFSQMQSFLSEKLPGKGTGRSLLDSIRSWAKKGEFKQEEFEWSGLEDWLKERGGKVSKQDVLDYLAENNVRVEEVEKSAEPQKSQYYAEETEDGVWGVWDDTGNFYGEYEDESDANDAIYEAEESDVIDEDAESTTKFSDYQLPGGENYKELLLTLPEKEGLPDGFKVVQKSDNKWIVDGPGPLNENQYASGVTREEALRAFSKHGHKGGYKSSHWDEPNVLAHIRFNERTGPNGEKILFIEEIQSDWHQEGRKKGYRNKGAEIKTTLDDLSLDQLQNVYQAIDSNGYYSLEDGEIGDRDELLAIMTDNLPYWAEEQDIEPIIQRARGRSNVDGTPNAPFKKSWPLLAFKRMVRYAAENNFDTIAWAPGEVQADRYDLSKQVENITARLFSKNNNVQLRIGTKQGATEQIDTTRDNLPDYVGKELADKILRQEVGRNIKYEGLDLKVGGEGMKGFYDKILPAEVNKFFNKATWGKAKVGQAEIEDVRAWSIPVTPEMKEKAMFEGMPLFSKAKNNQPKFSKAPTKDFSDDNISVMDHAARFIVNGGIAVKGAWKDRNYKHPSDKADISWFEKSFDLISHYAKKIPAFRRAYEHALRNSEIKTMIEQELTHGVDENGNPEKYVETFIRFKKKFRDEYNRLSKYLDDIDIRQIFWGVQEIDGQFQIMKPNGKPDGTVTETEDEAWEKIYEFEAARYVQNGGSSEGAKVLKRFRTINDRAFKMRIRGMEELQAYCEKEGVPAPTIADYVDGETVQVDLKVALAEMGSHRGYYMPRIRKQGEWVVYAEKEGESPILVMHDAKIIASGHKKLLEEQGYTVDGPRRSTKLSEDVYAGLGSILSQQAAVNESLKGINRGNKKITLEDLNITGAWKGKDYVVSGELRPEYGQKLIDMGAERKERIRPVKGGEAFSVEYTFKDAKKSIEDQAKEAIFKAHNIIPDIAFQLAQAMASQYADILRMRGSRSAMIARKHNYKAIETRDGKYAIVYGYDNKPTGKEFDDIATAREKAAELNERGVIRGFEEDAISRVTKSAYSLAGGEAKKQTALNMIRAITGTDISWDRFQEIKGFDGTFEEFEKQNLGTDEIYVDRGTFNEIQDSVNESPKYEDYVYFVNNRKIDPAGSKTGHSESMALFQDIMRNEERVDRVIGTLKGLAVLKYLGFRVAAPVVNMTNMIAGVPGAMAGYGKIPIRKAFKHIGKSYGEYRKFKNGTLEDKDLFNLFTEIEKRGWDKAYYNQEAMGILQNQVSNAMRHAIDFSMKMFSWSEQLNRVATISAAYKGLKESKPDLTTEERLRLAKEISDKAHGVYQKANRPSVMRGGNIAANVLQSAYVFKTFTHNYMATMIDLGFREKDAKAAAWLAFSPAIFGVGASVGAKVLISAIGSAMGSDDPENDFYRAIDENFGKGYGDLARHGAPGLFNINLRGSLDIGLADLPTSFKDLAGAPGSIITDTLEGISQMSRGNISKGWEGILPLAAANPLKGIRENQDGITTRSNAPVFYEGKPLKADAIDTFLRFLSFNPARISGARERLWADRKREYSYQEMRSEIYARLKKYYTGRKKNRSDLQDIELMIAAYNTKAEKAGQGLITKRSVKSVLRRAKVE